MVDLWSSTDSVRWEKLRLDDTDAAMIVTQMRVQNTDSIRNGQKLVKEKNTNFVKCWTLTGSF